MLYHPAMENRRRARFGQMPRTPCSTSPTRSPLFMSRSCFAPPQIHAPMSYFPVLLIPLSSATALLSRSIRSSTAPCYSPPGTFCSNRRSQCRLGLLSSLYRIAVYTLFSFAYLLYPPVVRCATSRSRRRRHIFFAFFTAMSY